MESESTQDSGLELILSQNVEDRVKEALSGLLAGEKFSVSAKVWVKKEQQRKEITQSSAENVVVEEEDEELLPGIPKLKTPTDQKKAVDSKIIKLISKVSVQRIAVKIFADAGISESLLESAKKVTMSAAGLDAARGDEVAVEKISYPKPVEQKKVWLSDVLLNPRYLWAAVGAILGLLFLLFLFGPARTLAKSYIQTVQMAAMTRLEGASAKAEGPSAAGAAKNPEKELEDALSAASAQVSQVLAAPANGQAKGNGHSNGNGNGHPFSFVTEKALPNFLHLMQSEKPPLIAVAVHYLDPALAAQVLASLPMDVRTGVIQQLAKVEERDPDEVKGLEAKVQERLHYIVGGEDKLLDLLCFSDPEIQPALLSAVRAVNPTLASNVERGLLSVESLAGLEPAVLQAVIRQMGLKVFCPLMTSMTEPLRAKIVGKLPGGQAQRVMEEIELSRPLPPSRYKEERVRLIGILRKLQQEGVLQ